MSDLDVVSGLVVLPGLIRLTCEDLGAASVSTTVGEEGLFLCTIHEYFNTTCKREI